MANIGPHLSAAHWALVALGARNEELEAEIGVLVDQLLDVACRADIERGMARAHQKNAMRFLAWSNARDAALDACQERIAGLLARVAELESRQALTEEGITGGA